MHQIWLDCRRSVDGEDDVSETSVFKLYCFHWLLQPLFFNYQHFFPSFFTSFFTSSYFLVQLCLSVLPTQKNWQGSRSSIKTQWPLEEKWRCVIRYQRYCNYWSTPWSWVKKVCELLCEQKNIFFLSLYLCIPVISVYICVLLSIYQSIYLSIYLCLMVRLWSPCSPRLDSWPR